MSLATLFVWFGLAYLRGQHFGLQRMRCEDCAVVCALVLLLRLARVPPPSGFSELVPLFRVNVWTLDAYVTGLCCDLRDPVEAFVLETVLDSERGWVDWDAVAASRARLFCHWCSVFQSLPGKRKAVLAPCILVLSRRLMRLWPHGVDAVAAGAESLGPYSQKNDGQGSSALRQGRRRRWWRRMKTRRRFGRAMSKGRKSYLLYAHRLRQCSIKKYRVQIHSVLSTYKVDTRISVGRPTLGWRPLQCTIWMSTWILRT